MSFYSKLSGFNFKKFQIIFYQKMRLLTRKELQPFYVASSPSTDRITFFFNAKGSFEHEHNCI